MIKLSSMQRSGSIFIVYDLIENPHPIDNNVVKMINSNQKSSIGLAKVSFDEQNGQKQRILFDVTGLTPLSEFIRRTQTQESYRQFILAIIRSIESFEEYMISVDQVILDPDYVYINIFEETVRFLCLPFADGAGSGCSLYEFFRMIRDANVSLQHGERSYYNLVNNVLNSPSSFSLENLRKILMPETQKKPKDADEYDRPERDGTPEKSSMPDQTGDITYNPDPYDGEGFFKVPEKSVLQDEPEEQEEQAEEGFRAWFRSLRRRLFPPKAEEEESGFASGLDGLADDTPKPAQKPAQKPAPNPARKPAPKPAQRPAPQDEESFHTIAVPSGSKAPDSEFGGLPGLTERENRLQEMLYADSQPPSGQSAFSGSMTGMQQEGFAAQSPRTLYGPPYAESEKQQPAYDAPPAAVTQETGRPECAPAAVQQPAPDPDDDPETELITDSDTRTVRMRHAWLISRRDGARIDLDKPLMRVGRNRPDIDIDLRHNVHVGHYHATLLRVDGEYVVIDEHSSNRTYVNHQRVDPDAAPEHRTKLKDGDLVIFADEAFEYHIEQ